MTIKDFLKMPTGMTLEQWEETLKEQEKIKRKLYVYQMKEIHWKTVMN